VLRELAEKMAPAGLFPKLIVNYTRVVKMVVASAVDSEGELIHPHKWNHDFIEMPIVRKELQHRPTVTEGELSEMLSNAKGRAVVLFALQAGIGLRIGEALALKAADLSPDCPPSTFGGASGTDRSRNPKPQARCVSSM